MRMAIHRALAVALLVLPAAVWAESNLGSFTYSNPVGTFTMSDPSAGPTQSSSGGSGGSDSGSPRVSNPGPSREEVRQRKAAQKAAVKEQRAIEKETIAALATVPVAL